jgi:hypothetical protein
MTIEVEFRYPVTPEILYQRLTDEEFLRAKYESLGSRALEFRECGLDEDVFRVEWTREVPSNPPGFAKKFLSEWNRLDEIMEWSIETDGSISGDYLAEIAGFPGKLEGEFQILADGKGCVEQILMRAKVGIPLVGKKIAEFAEQDAKRNLEGEDAFTRSELANKRGKR